IKHAKDILGAKLIVGEEVCNHVLSQRLAKALRLITMAVEVDLMPAEAFVQEKSASGRVSALLDFGSLTSRPHEIFLPDVYEKQLHYIYQGLAEERYFQRAGQAVPAGEKTDIEIQHFDFAQLARLSVHSAGSDFLSVLDREEQNLTAAGVVLIQIWLKLTWPWLGELVEGLRRRRYFLGGLLPRWFDDDGLFMQKRIGQPNWEGINLLTDRA
ncbi:MAG: hypothetical protein HQK55_14175, partial [Deltaproteobacteria bacterium]|nr:hypothetical protein [Deltaproteobacteria bacterium]